MDANISEIVVVCEELETEHFQMLIVEFKTIGMEITSTDDDESIVEGVIESYRLHEIEKNPKVKYVRRVNSYDVNYPPGDPRDRDGK